MKNSKLKTQNSKLIQSAFTLIELMIVVSILGILAAIALPEFQNHQRQAREAAAKDSLRTLRQAIERYYSDHGVPPGYPDNNTSYDVHLGHFVAQLVYKSSNRQGELADIGTPGYPFGPYLTDIPVNPITKKQTISVIHGGNPMPEVGSDTIGWYYIPSTRQILMAGSGTDSQDIRYLDY